MRLSAYKLRHVSLLVIVLFFFAPIFSRAAEFSKSELRNGGPDTIVVVGQLSLGDEKQFINAALNSENAIVVFQSPGGNLFAGIEIGKAVRLKGFSTYRSRWCAVCIRLRSCLAWGSCTVLERHCARWISRCVHQCRGTSSG